MSFGNDTEVILRKNFIVGRIEPLHMSQESIEEIDKLIYGSVINQIAVEYEPILTELQERTSAESNIDLLQHKREVTEGSRE